MKNVQNELCLFPHFLCYLLKSYWTWNQKVQSPSQAKGSRDLAIVCGAPALGCYIRIPWWPNMGFILESSTPEPTTKELHSPGKISLLTTYYPDMGQLWIRIFYSLVKESENSTKARSKPRCRPSLVVRLEVSYLNSPTFNFLFHKMG